MVKYHNDSDQPESVAETRAVASGYQRPATVEIIFEFNSRVKDRVEASIRSLLLAVLHAPAGC